MKFASLLILFFLGTTAARAGSVMVPSDPERSGALHTIPELVVKEIQKAGAKFQGEGLSHSGSIVSLKAHNFSCQSKPAAGGHSEMATCKLEVENEQGRARAAKIEDATAFLEALRSVDAASDGVDFEECDSSDSCTLHLRTVLCLVNPGLPAGTPGRENCSFSD